MERARRGLLILAACVVAAIATDVPMLDSFDPSAIKLKPKVKAKEVSVSPQFPFNSDVKKTKSASLAPAPPTSVPAIDPAPIPVTPVAALVPETPAPPLVPETPAPPLVAETPAAPLVPDPPAAPIALPTTFSTADCGTAMSMGTCSERNCVWSNDEKTCAKGPSATSATKEAALPVVAVALQTATSKPPVTPLAQLDAEPAPNVETSVQAKGVDSRVEKVTEKIAEVASEPLTTEENHALQELVSTGASIMSTATASRPRSKALFEELDISMLVQEAVKPGETPLGIERDGSIDTDVAASQMTDLLASLAGSTNPLSADEKSALHGLMGGFARTFVQGFSGAPKSHADLLETQTLIDTTGSSSSSEAVHNEDLNDLSNLIQEMGMTLEREPQQVVEPFLS